jgi:hypothetical protein
MTSTAIKPQEGHDSADGMVLVILGPSDDAPPGIPLGPARLSLGAGEDDDVFLGGVGVVPAHVQMVYLEGRATLMRATHEVRLDGQPVQAFPADWAPLQVLSLSADTHLAYGEPRAAWPQAPVWTVADDELVDASSQMDRDETAPSTSGQTGDDDPDQAGQGGPLRFERGLRTRREQVVQSARLGGWAVAAAAVVVVGLVLFDLVFGSREVVLPQEMAIDQSEDVLEKLLETQPAMYRTVRLNKRQDGAIVLTGLIGDEAPYRLLADQVRQQGVNSGGNVRLDALTPERLNTLVKDLLSRHPLGSRVEMLADQVEVTVFGVQDEEEVMNRLRSELKRLGDRIAPLKLVLNFNVKPADMLLNDISMDLNRRSATRDMQVTINDAGGKITGVVAAAVEGEARATLAELKASYADRLPLSIDLRVDPKLNFSVVSLMLGGNESTATLLQRGKTQTFRLGEPVFGTGELKDIRSDGVVLALGRREMFIPLIR